MNVRTRRGNFPSTISVDGSLGKMFMFISVRLDTRDDNIIEKRITVASSFRNAYFVFVFEITQR